MFDSEAWQAVGRAIIRHLSARGKIAKMPMHPSVTKKEEDQHYRDESDRFSLRYRGTFERLEDRCLPDGALGMWILDVVRDPMQEQIYVPWYSLWDEMLRGLESKANQSISVPDAPFHGEESYSLVDEPSEPNSVGLRKVAEINSFYCLWRIAHRLVEAERLIGGAQGVDARPTAPQAASQTPTDLEPIEVCFNENRMQVIIGRQPFRVSHRPTFAWLTRVIKGNGKMVTSKEGEIPAKWRKAKSFHREVDQLLKSKPGAGGGYALDEAYIYAPEPGSD